MPLPICSVCGKKIPPTVLEAHMKKSHPQAPKEHIEVPKTKFDYEASYFCRLCNVDIPQIIHPFHMHVVHGI